MATPLLPDQQVWIVGEKKNLAIKCWDENDPTTDLSSSTATIGIFDRLGNVVLAQGAAVITGTTLIRVSRLWDSTGTAVGFYRCDVIITFGTVVQIFQYTFEIRPYPSP